MRRACAVVSAVLLLAGCARGGAAERYAADAPLAEQCEQVPAGAQRAVVTAYDGTRLGAATLGRPDAGTAVVVTYGRSQTLCDWLGEADRLVREADVRVLVVDRRGTASAEGTADAGKEPGDVHIAMRWLQEARAGRVVLVGSSLGSVAAVAAARAQGPDAARILGFSPTGTVGPCALVAVSPALPAEQTAQLDLAALPAVWVTTESGNQTIAGNARALLDRSRAGDRAVRELSVDTDDHSVDLVQKHPEVQDFLAEAVRSCA